MPIRNTVKEYDAPAYYHVYSRGVGDRPVFHDDEDRQRFLSLFARYLDPDDDSKQPSGEEYRKHDLEIVAYCLMGNHFHLLLFQESDPMAMPQLMRSAITAYSMYFNRKYKLHGHVFQSAYKASRITSEAYLLHITRYIHMNPRNYLQYPWSSLRFYLGEESPAWLQVERVNSLSPAKYRQFLEDYEGRKTELELLKSQLAG